MGYTAQHCTCFSDPMGRCIVPWHNRERFAATEQLSSANARAYNSECTRSAELELELIGLRGRIAKLEQQGKELGEQLECDRSLVADCLTKARQAVSSRKWLTNGRGCYEWNDDRWHDEFRRAADEFLGALEPMQRVAWDWSECPKSGEEIAQARIDLKQRVRTLAKLSELVDRLEDDIRQRIEAYGIQAATAADGEAAHRMHELAWVLDRITSAEWSALLKPYVVQSSEQDGSANAPIS